MSMNPLSKVKPQFHFLKNDSEPFKVIVACRGGGKTVAAVQYALTMLLKPEHKNYQVVFFSSTLKVAKNTVGKPMRLLTQDFSNGFFQHDKSSGSYTFNVGKGDIRELRLSTYEVPDNSRGAHPDLIILDEAGLMPHGMFGTVIRPMFADKRPDQYRMIIIGTPNGHNKFYELFQRGNDLEYKTHWRSYMLKASDSGLLDQQEVAAARKDMSEAEFAQEYECDFDTNMGQGAVYSQYLYNAHDRLLDTITYNPALPVHTAWDLGHNDLTAVWFFQQNGDTIVFIDYYEGKGQDITWHIGQITRKPYNYGKTILPHDAVQHHVSSSANVAEIFQNFGLIPTVLERTSSVWAGIEKTKLLLKTARFNKTKCKEGIAHLANYRTKIDRQTGMNTMIPIHDIHSNAADAIRYVAEGKYIWHKQNVNPAQNRVINRNDYNVFC